MASATVFDLLADCDAQKRARNSRTLTARSGGANGNSERISPAHNPYADPAHLKAAMSLYDQLRTSSACSPGSRTSSISCSVASSSAPILTGTQIRAANEESAEKCAWLKLTTFDDPQQQRTLFNYDSAGCLVGQQSQEQDSEANTDSMLIPTDSIGDDSYRGRPESFSILGSARKRCHQDQQQQQQHEHEDELEHREESKSGRTKGGARQLVKQIFLSFSLCHSCSLIFQDCDKSSATKGSKRTARERASVVEQLERRERKQRTAAASLLCRYHSAWSAAAGPAPSATGHRSRMSSLSSINEREAFDAQEAISNNCPASQQQETGHSSSRIGTAFNQKHKQQQQQQPLSIDSLHGLRFLSMIWIIIIHTYSFAFQWSFFKYTSENIYKTAASQLIANGAFACDSFFLIGGFLLPYLTFPAHSPAASQRAEDGDSSEEEPSEHIAGACDLLYPLPSPPASPAPSPATASKAVKQSSKQQQLIHHQQRSKPPPAMAANLLLQPSQQQQQQQLDCALPSRSASACSSQPAAAAQATDGSINSLSRSSLNSFDSRQSAAAFTSANTHHQYQQQQSAKLAPHLFPLNCFRAQQVSLATNSEKSFVAAAKLRARERSKLGTSQRDSDSSGIKFTFARLLANLLHRYLRMMPLMMAIIGLSATLLRYLGEGPAWDYSTLMYDKWCRKNWWINGLFLHNFLNRENMCLSHSWYAAVDFQLFLLGQVILFVLARSRRLGIIMCCAFLFGGQLITAALTLVHHLPALPLHASVSQQSMSLYYGEIYIKPYCRASPYLIGILLAYLMRTTSLGQVKLSRWQVAAGWSASIGSLLLILLSTLPAMNGQPPGELESALYNALSRPLWACATGWMVFACITKHGGIFEKILSARHFIPFSRLSYPAFLVHPIVMAISYGGRQASVPFSHYLMLCLVLGNIVITYASAFVLSALFELPLLSVERAVKRTR